MDQIQFTLVISYLLMSVYFFTNWLTFSLRHPTSSPEEKFLSFIMVIITTIFWPVIIVISCLEIFKKGKLEFSAVVPVLLAICAFSISYYLSSVHEHWLCYYDLFCNYSS
ncbi:hypothetical protein FJR38_03450 [Anabaena sp. UHCC 0253]|uniref:hypothetical protein n=1 Tax=Anabaena sp. UHCC 0253 TaxID=2590019 RepID=UPI001445CD0F|nr:hypothetical protein [Anabaena sp. UHCC 0253]